MKNRTINATAGINGTLSSKGLLNVVNGSNKTLQIIPDIGYINSNIQVNGSTLSGRSFYTFNNVQSNQSINANFTASSSVDVLPSPWSANNIGTHLNTSVSGYRNGSFGITSYGSDIWGNSDQFAFINQTFLIITFG